MEMQSPIEALDSQASSRLIFDADTQAQSNAVFHGHGFELQSLGILIAPELRCEVVDDLQICSLPGTRSWLLGMAQLRGKILPVFDLQSMVFDSHKKRNTDKRVLIINAHEKGLGVLLPGLPKRLSFTESHRMTNHSGVPEGISPFSRQVFYQDRLWVELDFDGFFSQMATNVVMSH